MAKNLLGNAKEAKTVKQAMETVKKATAGEGAGSGPNLADLVKKDVKELKAINTVAEKLGDQL